MVQLTLIFALSLYCLFNFSLALEEFRVNPKAKLWTSRDKELDTGHRRLGGRKYLKKASPLKIDALIIKNEDELPENFDTRDKWPQCKNSIGTVRDQSYCESCWAVGSASVMTDLTCIACNGAVNPYISDEDLISCCLDCSSNNCEQGGFHDRAFSYWVNQGVVTGGSYVSGAGCSPYTVAPNVSRDTGFPQMPRCGKSCQKSYVGNYPVDKHKGLMYQVISGERDMQLALYHYGPLATSFDVYHDFQKLYDGGIYHWSNDSGEFEGGHVVKIIGWGVENGVKYWTAINSWGTKWGNRGLFKMLRGTNEVNFESVVVYGQASTDSCFAVVKQNFDSSSTSTFTSTTSTTATASTSTSTTPRSTGTTTSRYSSSTGRSSAATVSPFRFHIFVFGWVVISGLKMIFA